MSDRNPRPERKRKKRITGTSNGNGQQVITKGVESAEPQMVPFSTSAVSIDFAAAIAAMDPADFPEVSDDDDHVDLNEIDGGIGDHVDLDEINGGIRAMPDGNGLSNVVPGPGLDTWGGLVRLLPGLWADRGRTRIFSASKGKPVPIEGPPYMVKVERISEPENPDGDRASEQLVYDLSLTLGGETRLATLTHAQIISANLSAALGGIPGAARGQELTRQANIIFAQRAAFNLPSIKIPASTGLSLNPETGRPRFVLPDLKRRYLAGDDGEADFVDEMGDPLEPPAIPSAQVVAKLCSVEAETDSRGRLSILRGLTYRALAATEVPIETAAALVGSIDQGDDPLMLGGSGAGKTTSAKFVRGQFDPFKDKADFTFRGLSPAGLNARVGKRTSLTTFGDDFTWRTLAERELMARHVDTLTRASADGGELSQKAKKDGSARPGAELRGLTLLTGERTDLDIPVMRRLVLLRYQRGECNFDRLYQEWSHWQGIHIGITHAVVCLMLRHAAGGMLAEAVRELDEKWAYQLATLLKERHPDIDRELVASVARNYAKAMAGLELADLAIGIIGKKEPGPNVRTSWQSCINLASAQLEEMVGVASAGLSAEWVRAALRWMLAGHGHLLSAHTGLRLSDTTRNLSDHGYRLIARSEGDFYQPVGDVKLGWLDEESGERWLRPDRLLDGLRSYARVSHVAFNLTSQTMPATLTRLGVAIGESETRHTQRQYILSPKTDRPKERVRVIVIPPDSETEDGDALAETRAELGIVAAPSNWIPEAPLPNRSSRQASVHAFIDDAPDFTDKTPPANPTTEPVPAIRESIPAPVPANPARKRPPATVKANPRSVRNVLVLDAEQAWLIERDGVRAAPELIDKTRPGIPLDRLLDLCAEVRAEQLVLHHSWALAAGMPEEWQSGEYTRRWLGREGLAHPFAELSEASRWRLSTPGKLCWSMRARRNPGPENPVEIILPGYDHRIEFRDAPNAEILANALAEYRDATADKGRRGFSYRAGPGRTFIGMWRSLSRDDKAADIFIDLAPANFPEPAHLIPEPVADIGWARPPTAAEAKAGQCVVIDGNSQYLRVMGAVEYGIGSPEHFVNPQFDPHRPGWWRITYRAPNWPAGLPAPGLPLPPGETGWLVTETVAFLKEIGAEIEIAEGWLWRQKGVRALYRLQQRLAAARTRLIQRADDRSLTEATRAGAALALKALKTTYKTGIGWFSIAGVRGQTEVVPHHRPHWRHAIIARSTVNLLRDLWKAGERSGAYPVAIATDGIAYLTNSPERLAQELGLRLGTGLGEYKPAKAFAGKTMTAALAKLPSGPLQSLLDRARMREAIGEVLALITGGEINADDDDMA